MPDPYDQILEAALKVARREYRRLCKEDFYGSHHRSHHASDALLKAEKFMKSKGFDFTFGVEGACIPGDSDGFLDRDHRSVSYLNAGDTYNATLLWDETSEKFSVGCWGDWHEQAENAYEEDTDTINCAYCGHFTPRIEGVEWNEIVCEACGHCVDGTDAPPEETEDEEEAETCEESDG